MKLLNRTIKIPVAEVLECPREGVAPANFKNGIERPEFFTRFRLGLTTALARLKVYPAGIPEDAWGEKVFTHHWGGDFIHPDQVSEKLQLAFGCPAVQFALAERDSLTEFFGRSDLQTHCHHAINMLSWFLCCRTKTFCKYLSERPCELASDLEDTLIQYDPKQITVSECATKLGLTGSRVRKLASNGTFRAEITGGKRRQYAIYDISTEVWVAGGRFSPRWSHV